MKIKRIKDVAYDAEYLKKLKDLRARSKYIRNSLAREKLKTLPDRTLRNIMRKCDTNLAKKLSGLDQMSIVIAVDELLFGDKKFRKRFNEVSDILDIDGWALSPLLFFTAPRFFFYPLNSLKDFALKNWNIDPYNSDYLKFNRDFLSRYRKSDLVDIFKTPMELTAAFMTFDSSSERRTGEGGLVDSEDLKIIGEFLSEVKKLNLYQLKRMEVKWLRDFFDSLEDQQKYSLIERLKRNRVHPYIRRVVTSSPYRGVVVDASNIMLSGLVKADPIRLKDLMNALGIHSNLYFPVIFVFDANADYIVKKSRDFWRANFKGNQNVIFHSPADELVLKIAIEKKYHIVSNDKYRDYEPHGCKVFTFRPDRGHYYLQEG